ncbi:unnamed protein product [Adineta ricciae]|uniref:Uncharacterized protein n=1 Tax=Adineta ricciae TaxID=249248 RepID=A0A815VKL8_ADIRI|nr:unnamed protein product [Adineta ricciae]CAF1533256.1 unnamed protein product [Adineta ricciae]
MQTCRFSYLHRTTLQPITALGVERSWEDLKQEFNYRGSAYSGATCYKTISKQGPDLFAVVNNRMVLYYENEQWHCYKTATDIQIGAMDMSNVNSNHVGIQAQN